MADRGTLDVYAKRAEDYARRFGTDRPSSHLCAFVDMLPEQARVLDLGCGPGNAAAYMVSLGHKADAWDASPEMAEQGRALFNLPVRVAAFEALEAVDHYDGIYANFSLLHAPKADMPSHLARICRALKPNGVFHIGTKLGIGEKRDAIGRFYAFYEEDELVGLLEDAGYNIETRAYGEETGLDGVVAPWIVLKARKHV